MSTTSTSTTTQKRKVARIVYDRAPLKKLSFVLWTAAGLVVGLLLAALLDWLGFRIGDPERGDFLRILITEEWKWWSSLVIICTLAGAAIGWGWKRELRARIEHVEQPTMQRRRSASTAMVRVDYGRRW